MTSEKIKYCIAGSKKLSRDDLRTIGRLISLRGYHDKIKESADGCRINLDLISKGSAEGDHDLVDEIYNFIKNRNG